MEKRQGTTYSRSHKQTGLHFLPIILVFAASLMSFSGPASANQPDEQDLVYSLSPQAESAGEVKQEPIIEVEVDVRDLADVALLQSLGYTCQVGICQLELPQGKELILNQAGLSVRVTARAIKLSGSGAALANASSPDTEYYTYADDWSNHDIPDTFDGQTAFETTLQTWEAPENATISRVKYSARFVHQRVDDLWIHLSTSGAGYVWIWEGWGDFHDDGLDDDDEYDADIEIQERETYVFNGKSVNQVWNLWIRDYRWLFSGYVDYWKIYVYYNLTCPPLNPPENPVPGNDAMNVARDSDLDWDDVPGASTYRVYHGITNPPFRIGGTMSSDFPLEPLAPSTHYYWKIGVKNECGTMDGPIWEYTTACWAPDEPSLYYPANGATGVPIDTDLDWGTVPGASYYRVYFGTLNPPSNKIYFHTTESRYDPGMLRFDKHYYWKVVAYTDCASTSSPVWDFRTQPGIFIFLPIALRQQ